jgi:hypothetical protein
MSWWDDYKKTFMQAINSPAVRGVGNFLTPGTGPDGQPVSTEQSLFGTERMNTAAPVATPGFARDQAIQAGDVRTAQQATGMGMQPRPAAPAPAPLSNRRSSSVPLRSLGTGVIMPGNY